MFQIAVSMRDPIRDAKDSARRSEVNAHALYRILMSIPIQCLLRSYHRLTNDTDSIYRIRGFPGLVRLTALRDPTIKQALPKLGKPKIATSGKAQRVLGWAPGSNEEAIVTTAESLLWLGLLKEMGRQLIQIKYLRSLWPDHLLSSNTFASQ